MIMKRKSLVILTQSIVSPGSKLYLKHKRRLIKMYNVRENFIMNMKHFLLGIKEKKYKTSMAISKEKPKEGVKLFFNQELSIGVGA